MTELLVTFLLLFVVPGRSVTCFMLSAFFLAELSFTSEKSSHLIILVQKSEFLVWTPGMSIVTSLDFYTLS